MLEDKKERKRFSTFYISKERHHRANPRIWGANRSRGLLWGHCGEKPIADSNLRRCDRLYDIPGQLKPGMCAWLGNLGRGDWPGRERVVTAISILRSKQ